MDRNPSTACVILQVRCSAKEKTRYAVALANILLAHVGNLATSSACVGEQQEKPSALLVEWLLGTREGERGVCERADSGAREYFALAFARLLPRALRQFDRARRVDLDETRAQRHFEQGL